MHSKYLDRKNCKLNFKLTTKTKRAKIRFYSLSLHHGNITFINQTEHSTLNAPIVFLIPSTVVFYYLWKVNRYGTVMHVTLAFSKSRSLPMVVRSLQRHSKLSPSWFFSSLTMQSCMMGSVNILSLNSSPMNLIFPVERLRALSFASSSSSCNLSLSAGWVHILY